MDDDTSDNEYNDESLSDHQDEFVNNVKMRRKSGSTAIKRRHAICYLILIFKCILFLFIF